VIRPASPDGVDWANVAKWARTGADEDEIVAALGLPRAAPRPILERIREEIARGKALQRLDVRVAMRKRGIHEGSVNTLKTIAREVLGWGRNEFQEGGPPDLAELERVLLEQLDKLERRGGPGPAAGEEPDVVGLA
jgi:hypothetical protein